MNHQKTAHFLTKTEKIKETIYGLVTLLATTIGLLLHINDTTPKQAFGLLFGTMIGLWLACFFADILAQSITTPDKNERKHAYRHAFDASLGILIAGRMPVLFLGLALFGIIHLRSALFASIGAIVIQLFLFSILSLYHRQEGLFANLITLGLQGLLFFVIILLKLGH